MELTKRNLTVFLGIGLCFTLFAPLFYSFSLLAFFIPSIVIACYQKSFLACLWLAFLCGLAVDLLSMTRLGITSLSYVSATWVLYKHKMNFFRDRQSTLPIMTFLFSGCSVIFVWLFSYLFEPHFVFALAPFLKELVLSPFFNAIYAYVIFIAPCLIKNNLVSYLRLNYAKKN